MAKQHDKENHVRPERLKADLVGKSIVYLPVPDTDQPTPNLFRRRSAQRPPESKEPAQTSPDSKEPAGKE